MVTFDGVTKSSLRFITLEIPLNISEITSKLPFYNKKNPFAVQIEDVLQHQNLTF